MRKCTPHTHTFIGTTWKGEAVLLQERRMFPNSNIWQNYSPDDLVLSGANHLGQLCIGKIDATLWYIVLWDNNSLWNGGLLISEKSLKYRIHFSVDHGGAYELHLHRSRILRESTRCLCISTHEKNPTLKWLFLHW